MTADFQTMEFARAGSVRTDSEFLKNSINTDKFTGFFDKFLKIRFVEYGRIIISLQDIHKVIP